jgi:hypothetical protein
MMIPDPGIVVIEVVRRATDPGMTESDVIRWAGVVVGVAGVVLAIPDGIAAAWRWVKNWRDRAWSVARRLLGRPGQLDGSGGTQLKKLGFAGQGYVDKWQPWREDAEDGEKIGILHEQIEIVRDMIVGLRQQADRTAQDLKNDVREAEGRVTGQLRELASEIRGERSQASRVDARGFGPIAFGIILTGLPDELAAVAVVGWLVVGGAVVWTVCAFPGWLKDYTQALRYDNG